MSVKLMDDISHPAKNHPPGYRVVSLPLDAQRRVNDQLHRGDLVDVVAYFEQGDRFPELPPGPCSVESACSQSMSLTPMGSAEWMTERVRLSPSRF